MHLKYEIRLEHPADFRVKFRFYTEEENGRKTLPYQGYRSDFWYEHPEHSGTNQIFMIWTEFENKNLEIVNESDIPINRTGTAQMWIMVPERRDYHVDKIKVGLKGCFMEGSRKVADCEVVELIGLKTNPREKNK